MNFDLHMHTSRHSPDSEMDPFEMLAVAKRNRLDGIVITEHDFHWPESELEELRAAEPSLVILAGIEVTAREGDVLCYGINDAKSLPRGIRWKELCQEVHYQGGVAVAAHPYRWSQRFSEIMKDDSIHLDGLEMMSKNMDQDLRILASKFAETHPQYAQLGNSDSHDTSTLGCCHTAFEVPILTIADLVEAIRNRQCRAISGLPRF